MHTHESSNDSWQSVELWAYLWILNHIGSQINKFVQMLLTDFPSLLGKRQVETVKGSSEVVPRDDLETFWLRERVIIVEIGHAEGLLVLDVERNFWTQGWSVSICGLIRLSIKILGWYQANIRLILSIVIRIVKNRMFEIIKWLLGSSQWLFLGVWSSIVYL